MRYFCWLAPETSYVIKWGLVFVLQKYTYFFYFVGISIRKFCHTFAAVIFSDNIYLTC